MAPRVSGRLTQNTQRQLSGWMPEKNEEATKAAATATPYSVPSTLPSSWAAPTTPKAVDRRCSAHRSATSAIVTGSRAPPATPCSTRPPTSSGRPTAMAVTADPIANPTRQPCSTSRLPKRSESWASSGIPAT